VREQVAKLSKGEGMETNCEWREGEEPIQGGGGDTDKKNRDTRAMPSVVGHHWYWGT